MADFKINYAFSKRHRVFIDQHNDVIHVICANPTPDTLLEIRRAFSQPITIEEVDEQEFSKLLNEHFEKRDSSTPNIAQNIEDNLDLNTILEEMPDIEDLLESQEEAPVIKLINALLGEAINMNASDIHFEVFKNEFSVRFRIDGVLHEIFKPSKNLSGLIVSRIKVMAKLDIAEKKIPQDGRISLKIAGRMIDVRVSVLPSNHGERVVLRILDQKNAKLDLDDLVPRDAIKNKIKRLIDNSHGIILVTGPTGSGKTTTLYGAINHLNEVERNIITVEDPIEYDLPGIGQTQVNPKVGMTFAKGLRAILRQDPDVIMVGEIRDKETADIAIEASLTGHLVLSTLHTNSALGAITRLQDMGVQSFLLSSSLLGVIAQRLIRKVCPHCKQPYTPSEKEQELYPLFKGNHTLYHAKGCKACKNVGYIGRIAIYEIIEIDERLKEMIHEEASELDMKNYASQKTDDLLTDGLKRVLEGETTLEEVLRVISGHKVMTS
ncbi:MAG: type II secretion system ATPase GspE [Proteobacteria bacterium]|nr:type II secretion system ATPase GspE [Pseudomonadota bacterium]